MAFEESTRQALEEAELHTAKLRSSEADALARRTKAAEAPAQASPLPPPPSVGPSLESSARLLRAAKAVLRCLLGGIAESIRCGFVPQDNH